MTVGDGPIELSGLTLQNLCFYQLFYKCPLEFTGINGGQLVAKHRYYDVVRPLDTVGVASDNFINPPANPVTNNGGLTDFAANYNGGAPRAAAIIAHESDRHQRTANRPAMCVHMTQGVQTVESMRPTDHIATLSFLNKIRTEGVS
jgi:hypothetical protein